MNERPRPPTRGAIHPLLKMAAIGGVDSAIRLHIKRGADVNATDERGRSALMLAAQRGHARTCRLLLEAGADPAQMDSDGLDALAHAQPRRHAEVVIALLEHRSRTRRPEIEVVADRSPELVVLYVADPAFDTSGWEAEPETVVPKQDLQPVLASAAIQDAISTHLVIDRDATWEDIDVRLPDKRPKLGAPSDLDDDTVASWRALIGIGLRWGALPESAVVAAADQDAIPTEDADWLLRETLTEFGVALEEFGPWVADAFDSPFLEDDDDDAEARTDAALDHLLALRRDRDRVYWSCLNSASGQVRLRRDDEAARGAEIEAGVAGVLEALARSPFLCDALTTPLGGPEVGGDGEEEETGRDEFSDDERDEASARSVSALCDLAGARRAAVAPGRECPLGREQLREVGAARAQVRRLALELRRRGIHDDSARLYLAGADRWHDAWGDMVVANLRLAVHLVKKSWKNGVSAIDLIQEANTGLMRAAEKFDFRRGTGFATYAAWWVRARVQRHASCATLVRTPAYLAELRRKVANVQRRFEAAGIEFNSADLAEAAGVETAAVNRARALAAEFLPIPRLPDDLDDGLEAIGPEDCTPEDLVADSELRRQVVNRVGALGPREALVVQLRFGFVDGEYHTLSEIGEHIGVSRERVRQIERAALEHLRQQDGIRDLLHARIVEAPDED